MQVLLPAFCLGCIVSTHTTSDDVYMDHTAHYEDHSESKRTRAIEQGRLEDAEAITRARANEEESEKVNSVISAVFMVLVGLSMPSLFGYEHLRHQYQVFV